MTSTRLTKRKLSAGQSEIFKQYNLAYADMERDGTASTFNFEARVRRDSAENQVTVTY
jgi:hypothetical protein